MYLEVAKLGSGLLATDLTLPSSPFSQHISLLSYLAFQQYFMNGGKFCVLLPLNFENLIEDVPEIVQSLIKLLQILGLCCGALTRGIVT